MLRRQKRTRDQTRTRSIEKFLPKHVACLIGSRQLSFAHYVLRAYILFEDHLKYCCIDNSMLTAGILIAQKVPTDKVVNIGPRQR